MTADKAGNLITPIIKIIQSIAEFSSLDPARLYQHRGWSEKSGKMEITTMTAKTPAKSTIPWLLIICGCLIAMMTFGGRSTMGFFQLPMIEMRGWSRTDFALGHCHSKSVLGSRAALLRHDLGQIRHLARNGAGRRFVCPRLLSHVDCRKRMASAPVRAVF